MSIRDIIKNSFLEGFEGNVPSVELMVLCLVAALLLGFYIYAVYRLSCSASFYSPDFNLSLIMISVITCAIILTIQSSVIVSLGMVGALSIVRFRTAVKSSVDLVFLFWAISIGIITGTSLIGLAVLVSVLLSVLVFVFRKFSFPARNSYYVSVEAADVNASDAVLECIRGFDARCKVISQSASDGRFRMTVEVNTLKPGDILKALNEAENVKNVNIIAHGENTGI